MSAIKEANPNVSVVVNYTDLPFILNVFKNRTLSTMEKIAIEELDTVGYFERTIENNKSELVRIQFNVEIELAILIRKIKAGSFFKGVSMTEKLHLGLDTLVELILDLPNEYEKQIIAKKFEVFDN